jgi:carbon starvation protein CstA
MLFFFLCVALLIVGYFTYGLFVEKIFAVDASKTTPAVNNEDGIDYVPMPTWRVFLVQLLNIAGLGPIIGPIVGALYGPIALLWIVIGSIFAGAVHDFASGMMSLRRNGESIPEVIGDSLGSTARHIMRIFSFVLLVLVGAIFVIAPSALINNLLKENGFDLGQFAWITSVCIFIYYFVATMIPIDKIIGRLYPFFGALLLIMTFGVAGGLIVEGYDILPNLDMFTNTHPGGVDKFPIWPLLFITISCGALSGFHSTQSPIMARCLKTEKHARLTFYGAMIVEGIIGLIWCTVGLSFYQTPEMLAAVKWSGVVNEVANTLLGRFGGILAILGVIILPITSGDTAFRGARLIVAETFNIPQKNIMKRLLIAIPLFAIGITLVSVGKSNWNIIWQYFGWSNQMLATMVLWSASVYLIHRGKFHWITTVPATFMTAVVITFIAYAKIGFNIDYQISVYIGIAVAALIFTLLLTKVKSKATNNK